MKLFTFISIMAMLVVISSCGEKKSELEEVIEVTKNLPEAVEKAENAQEKAQQRWEERKRNGDTTAIHFKELEQYFPSDVFGFTAGEFDGETVNMVGMSFSQTSRHYKGTLEDGSEIEIEANLFDYNAVSTMFATTAFTWLSGYSMQNSDGYDRSFELDQEDCYGFETFRNSSGKAEVTLAVGYRFIIQIKARRMKDTEILKDIAKKFKLSELAAL